MKKQLALFALSATLLTAGIIVDKSEIKSKGFEESATDLYSKENNIKKIRKTDEVVTPTVETSIMYAQSGNDGTNSYLRFATAVKGDVTSITFNRKVEGKEDRPLECKTLYKGISSNGKTYYYNGEDLVTAQDENTNNYYWACYTIKFEVNSSYLDKNITLEMTINGESGIIANKTTSYKFDSQIGKITGIQVTKELTSSYLVGQAITFDELEVSSFDANGSKVATIPSEELEFYEGEEKLDLSIIGYTEAGNHTITAKYKEYSVDFNMNIANNIYDVEAENIYNKGEKPTVNNVNYIERDNCNTDIKELKPIVYGSKPEGGTDYASYDKADAKNASGQAYLGEVKNGNSFNLHIFSGVEKQVTLYMTASSGVIEKDIASWQPVKMADIQLNKMIEISKNGNALSIGDDVILPGSETPANADGKYTYDPNIWANFVRVAIGTVNLNQGDNVINVTITSSIKNEDTITKSNGTMNIDKFDLVDNIGYLVEAEEAMNKSEIVPTNRTYVERVKYSGNQLGAMLASAGKKDAENASGKGYMGEIKGGNAFNVHVWSDVERDVNVIMSASSGVIEKDVASWKPIKMADIQLNQMISAETNGTSFTISDDIILPGSETPAGEDGKYKYDPLIWAHFIPVNLGTMHLNKGDNVITIKIIKQIAFTGEFTKRSGTLNIDYFAFNYID